MTTSEVSTAPSNGKSFDDQELVATIAKNSRETIFVRRGSFKGHAFVDVRVFVEGKDGEPIATKKGLAVAPDKVPDLIAAIEKAVV